MRLTDIIARMQDISNRLRGVILPAPYYVVAKIGRRRFTMEELVKANRDLLNPVCGCTDIAQDPAMAKTQVINSNISKLLAFFDRCSHAYRQASTPILYALHKVRTDTSTRLRALAREADFAAPEFELRFYDLDTRRLAALNDHPFVIGNGGIDTGQAEVCVKVK